MAMAARKPVESAPPVAFPAQEVAVPSTHNPVAVTPAVVPIQLLALPTTRRPVPLAEPVHRPELLLALAIAVSPTPLMETPVQFVTLPSAYTPLPLEDVPKQLSAFPETFNPSPLADVPLQLVADMAIRPCVLVPLEDPLQFVAFSMANKP
jgi:hypothetical protein